MIRSVRGRDLSGPLVDIEAATLALTTRAVGSNARLPYEDAVRLLDRVQRVRQALSYVEAALERRLGVVVLEQRREPRERLVEGVGQVEVRRSTNRRGWDHEGLAHEVIERHLAADPDGVEPTPWAVRDWFLEAAGIGYWKVTALRALRIRVGDYCDETPGPPAVKITRPRSRR